MVFSHFLTFQRVADPFRFYGYDETNRQAPGEGAFFLALTALGTLAAVGVYTTLLRAFGERLDAALDWLAAHRRFTVATLAIGCALACAVIGQVSFLGQYFTDDESAYLFTAKLLRHGSLTAPAVWPIAPGHYQFLTQVGQRVFAIYGVVHPALLVPGLLFGMPRLGVLAAVAVVVVCAAGIARELGGERAGVLAAFLAASSPFLLATGATLHNATSSAALCGLFLLGLVRHDRTLALGDACLAGLALGLAVHVRVLDAMAYAAPALPLVLVRMLTGPFRKRRLLGYAALASCAVAGVATYLWLNSALTGDWLRTSYDVFNQRWPNTSMFGFGKGPLRYFENTPEIAFSRVVSQMGRGYFWMFGWPIGVLPIVLARGRGVWLAAGILAGLLFGYFIYFANSVFDTGPVYYLSMVPVCAMLAARGLLALGELRPRAGAPVAATVALAACAFAFFVPREMMAAREVARSIRRPKLPVKQENIHHGVVLVTGMQPSGPAAQSWVFYPPIPGYPLEQEDVIWASDPGVLAAHYQRMYPDRRFYRLRWGADASPFLEPLPAAAGSPRPR